MNCPYHTEAPEKVRELPPAKPAKAHGETWREVLYMLAFFACFALLMWGAYDAYRNPQNHYPKKVMEWSVAEEPSDAPGDDEEETYNTLQPVTTLAPASDVLGSAVPGSQNVVAAFGKHELTNQKFIYYYWDCFYSLYEQMGSYMTSYLNFQKPFDQQYVNDTQSWHQYLTEMAVETWRQTILLSEEAEKNAFVLPQEYEEALVNSDTALGNHAETNGYESKDAYLQMMFDPCADLESYQAYNRESTTAGAYSAAKYKEFYDKVFDPNAKIQYCIDVRHILIQPEVEGDATSMEAAKKQAEALYKEWQIIPTEDHFQELAGTHTMDTGSALNGGLYEDVYPGQMVVAFNDWCFDESRQPGDHGIVETEYGYHLMYFVGTSETVYKDENDTAAQAEYTVWLDDLFAADAVVPVLENIVFTDHAE